MGDVVSSHLDEDRRERVTARTDALMEEFERLYEQQVALALCSKVRMELEGGGAPGGQLLQRKVPLEKRSIFSGSVLQYLEENRRWRKRFLLVPDTYDISCYDSQSASERRAPPRGTITCAGCRVLTSVDQYQDLLGDSLPDLKAQAGAPPPLKYPTSFPVILWHPFARHVHLSAASAAEQQTWKAVLQDCVRHSNDALSDGELVHTSAFTDAVRLLRQAQGHYGTWELMCGGPEEILSNLVMEQVLPELREQISPKIKGKQQEKYRTWILVSDAVYALVRRRCAGRLRSLLLSCDAQRPLVEDAIRKNMDQITVSKEQVSSKVKAVLLPKAEKLLALSIQPYLGSILEALMDPTSRGFAEVRQLLSRELAELSRAAHEQGGREAVAKHMERLSLLAFHPVKMQPCYDQLGALRLDGLQQRFDVGGPAVFLQRAQILMRQQMDNAVFTFEQLLHQSLEAQRVQELNPEELSKSIQRCQDRVLKKFDYDSSSVRKRFFREALLQIFIPYMLKQLSPACSSDLRGLQDLIFEDVSRFVLVENIFEEVVLQSVMKDISTAVREAAVQRKHNLYRDSIVLSDSDPHLHLLQGGNAVDWAGQFPPGGGAGGAEAGKAERRRQVVSMIQGAELDASDGNIVIEKEEGEEEEEEQREGSQEVGSREAPPLSPIAEEAPPLSTGEPEPPTQLLATDKHPQESPTSEGGAPECPKEPQTSLKESSTPETKAQESPTTKKSAEESPTLKEESPTLKEESKAPPSSNGEVPEPYVPNEEAQESQASNGEMPESLTSKEEVQDTLTIQEESILSGAAQELPNGKTKEEPEPLTAREEAQEPAMSNMETRKPPTAKEEAWTGKEEATAGKEEATAGKEEAPAVKEEAPAVKEEAPAGKEELPEPPTAEEEAPESASAKEEAPTTIEEVPTGKEEAPTTKEEAPEPSSAKEEVPTTEEEAPTRKEEVPTGKEEAPEPTTGKEEAPTTKEEAPEPTTGKEEAPEPTTGKEEAPTTKEEAPEPTTGKEDVPTTKEEAPEPTTGKEEAPTTKEEAPEPTTGKKEALEPLVPTEAAS